jgi:hypothetical protein
MERDLDTLLRYELADENYFAELEARRQKDRQEADQTEEAEQSEDQE